MKKTGCRIAILDLGHWYSALAYTSAFAGDPRIKISGITHHDLVRAQKVASDSGVVNGPRSSASSATSSLGQVGLYSPSAPVRMVNPPDLQPAVKAHGHPASSMPQCLLVMVASFADQANCKPAACPAEHGN